MPKNETNDGGTFGRMGRQGCKRAKLRNSQMAEYGATLKELDAAIMRCRDGISKVSDGLSPQCKYDFAHLFNLANLGRYYVLVMLKETAEILTDADLIRPGDDPWYLGGGVKI